MSKDKHPGFVNVKLACGHMLSVSAVPWVGEIQMFGEALAYKLAKAAVQEQAKKFVCSYAICRSKHGLPIHEAISPNNTEAILNA